MVGTGPISWSLTPDRCLLSGGIARRLHCVMLAVPSGSLYVPEPCK